MDSSESRRSPEPEVTFEPVKLTDVGLSCATCFYWQPIPTSRPPSKNGYCRRNPPNATPPDCAPEWPLSDSDDVCGEWHTDTEPPARLGLAEYSEPELPDVCGAVWTENGIEVACANLVPCPLHKYPQRVIDDVQRAQLAGGLPPFAPDVIARTQARGAEDRLPPGSAPKDATGCDV